VIEQRPQADTYNINDRIKLIGYIQVSFFAVYLIEMEKRNDSKKAKCQAKHEQY